VKIILSVTVFFIVFSVITIAQNNYRTGLLVPTKEQLSKVAIIRPRPGAAPVLRDFVDLSQSPFVPKAGMQGYYQNSCTAWSLVYGMVTYLKAKEMNWPVMNGAGINSNRVFSPALVYNVLKNSPGCDSGIFFTSAFEFLTNAGNLQLSRFAYEADRCSNRQPTSAELAAAKSTRIMSYNLIFDAFNGPQGRTIEILDVQAELNRDRVVAVGVHLDQSVFSDNYGDRSHGPERPYIWDHFIPGIPIEKGYHAMLCVGYDNNIQAFKVLNSWDTDFGNGGYIWISYNVFRQTVKEAYTATLVPGYARPAPASTGLPTFLDEGANFAGTDFIADTNWIKKGYYRQYESLRVGCIDINPSKKSAIIRLSDVNDNTARIATIELKAGEPFREFEYKGRVISIKLNKIGRAGRNPFTKASFYELNYRNVSGERFTNP
jgi:hypothetical protein